MSSQPTALVVYYSFTGNTATVARSILAELDGGVRERITPRTRRRYPNWLFRSFIPGSTVPIEPVDHEPTAFDVVFLGTPKWTLSCPPVTEYLDRVQLEGTTVGLFLTYGGFDQRRYTRRLVDQLRMRGAHVAGMLLVKRDTIRSDRYAAGVEEFVSAVDERARGA